MNWKKIGKGWPVAMKTYTLPIALMLLVVSAPVWVVGLGWDWAQFIEVLKIFTVLVTGLVILAALNVVLVFTTRWVKNRVKDGLRALKPRFPGILRLFYWPALGAGLFFSLATTWIEWHQATDLGNFVVGNFSNYYDAYNAHLAWAVLAAAIFTGLLAVAVKRLWRAARTSGGTK